MEPPQFEQISKSNLYETIALKIEQKILSGEIKVGEKLSSENALSQMFGVSRNVVREALRGLKEWGLIDIKTGSGAFVSRPDLDLLKSNFTRLITLNDFTLEEFFDVRILIESHAAYEAGQSITEAELAELKKSIDAMKGECSSAEWSSWELFFHNMVAKASHNKLLYILVSSLSGIMSDFFAKGFLFLDYSSINIQERKELTNRNIAIISHEKIFDALKAHHPEESKEAMESHLIKSKRAYIE